MDWKKLIPFLIASGVLSVFIVFVDLAFFSQDKNIFQTFLIVPVFVFVSPIIVLKYQEHRRIKQLEEKFPVFLRDFVEGVRGGMTIPQAIKSVASNDYKILSPYVKKMAAQMDWGVPVDKVLLKFAKESKSKFIGRIISSVIESHRFGGNLTDTLEALSSTAMEIEKLRAERRLYLQSQTITGYMVFFVFLIVILVLERFLLPSFAEARTVLEEAAQQQLIERYKTIFRNLIVIQGFFAGLTVGKMAEGAVIAGIKHSLFMICAGVLINFIAG